MATKSPKEIATKIFKENPKVREVFVCDGYSFLSKNAANLHATTSKPNKTLNVVVVKNESLTVVKSNEDSESQTDEKPVNRMNKNELQEKATALDIEFLEEDTKAVLIAKIQTVLNPKQEE